jgi:glycosyltransferase involved in cell wall biosynthesis
MHVLHLRSSGDLLGAETVILQLVSALQDRHVSSTVACVVDPGDPEPQLLREAAARGAGVEAIPSSGRFDVNLPSRVRAVAQRCQASLLHTHGYKEDIAAVLARTGLPIVATNHLWKRTSWQLQLYALLDALALQCVEQVVAVSEPIAGEMQRVGVPASRIAVIRNGLDPAPFLAADNATTRRNIRRTLGLDDHRVLLIGIGSLTEEKGFDVLLASLPALRARNPELALLIIGDGPLRNELTRRAERLGVEEHVRFLGRRRDVADLLACADIFVLPSRREGLPMVLLEAMAAGKAIVATAVGEVPTVLENTGGLCVAPGDSGALTDALASLVTDRARREARGRSAREALLAGCTAAGMAEQYLTLYRSLVRCTPYENCPVH